MRITVLVLIFAAAMCAGCSTMQTKMKSSEEQTKLLPVDAASNEGTLIGHFKEGDKIVVQYVSGMWNVCKSLNAVVSPDVSINDYDKCAIYKMTDKGLIELIVIPNGTKTKPLAYTFREDCDAYLRSHDYARDDNEGSVNYRVIKE